MNPRRERFKHAMSRFEPSDDPADALKHGLYVEAPSQSIANRTHALLELRPRSSHIIAGPSGTGKTMQLRVLERALNKADDLDPLFVDVTTPKRDLQQPGQLIEHLTAQLQSLKIKDQSKGELGPLLVMAILHALAPKPSPAVDLLGRVLAPAKAPMTDAVQTIAQLKRKPVLLLDSLDRLPIEVFTELATGDLAKIQEHMAVVVVGPPAVMYGAAREVVDQFDYFLRQPTYHPTHGGEMHAFLTQILRQRADEDMLPAESCVPLVEASGGILRDLIALTQLALEESYVAGHERVEVPDVRRAIDTFGRKHIIGLDSRELDLLQHLRTTGNFVRVDDRDVSLLVTRRVLEYAGPTGAPTFAVHPTLLPLLELMEGA